MRFWKPGKRYSTGASEQRRRHEKIVVTRGPSETVASPETFSALGKGSDVARETPVGAAQDGRMIKDLPVAAISSGLAAFLTPALQGIDPAAMAVVHELRSAPQGPAVAIFLYTISDDSLYFLISAWGSEPLESHRLLARALSRLKELAVITLEAESGQNMRFQVCLHPMTLEDQTRLWQSLRLAFRPSLACEVRPIGD